jgi:hypothetical protein
MRRTRLRNSILLVPLLSIVAPFGAEAAKRQSLDQRRRADGHYGPGSKLGRFSFLSQPGRLVPPLSDQPVEVSLAPAAGEQYWGLFPALGDLDGDGRSDLMIGSGMGRMRFHRNIGTAERPEFDAAVWFEERCPDGRIPTG